MTVLPAVAMDPACHDLSATDPGDLVSARRRGHAGGMFRSVHHVQLAMPPGKEPEAREFFVGVLGMEEIRKPPVLAARGGAWFSSGEVDLHLGVEDDFRPAQKAHPGILVDDIEDVVRRLAAAGQEVTWDTDFLGFRRVYADDPFGNRLEFLQPNAPG
jgi:catechol 2,3-dioxygenase-like lactoylglutathione lyase family enzyme